MTQLRSYNFDRHSTDKYFFELPGLGLLDGQLVGSSSDVDGTPTDGDPLIFNPGKNKWEINANTLVCGAFWNATESKIQLLPCSPIYSYQDSIKNSNVFVENYCGELLQFSGGEVGLGGPMTGTRYKMFTLPVNKRPTTFEDDVATEWENIDVDSLSVDTFGYKAKRLYYIVSSSVDAEVGTWTQSSSITGRTIKGPFTATFKNSPSTDSTCRVLYYIDTCGGLDRDHLTDSNGFFNDNLLYGGLLTKNLEIYEVPSGESWSSGTTIWQKPDGTYTRNYDGAWKKVGICMASGTAGTNTVIARLPFGVLPANERPFTSLDQGQKIVYLQPTQMIREFKIEEWLDFEDGWYPISVEGASDYIHNLDVLFARVYRVTTHPYTSPLGPGRTNDLDGEYKVAAVCKNFTSEKLGNIKITWEQQQRVNQTDNHLYIRSENPRNLLIPNLELEETYNSYKLFDETNLDDSNFLQYCKNTPYTRDVGYFPIVAEGAKKYLLPTTVVPELSANNVEFFELMDHVNTTGTDVFTSAIFTSTASGGDNFSDFEKRINARMTYRPYQDVIRIPDEWSTVNMAIIRLDEEYFKGVGGGFYDAGSLTWDFIEFRVEKIDRSIEHGEVGKLSFTFIPVTDWIDIYPLATWIPNYYSKQGEDANSRSAALIDLTTVMNGYEWDDTDLCGDYRIALRHQYRYSNSGVETTVSFNISAGNEIIPLTDYYIRLPSNTLTTTTGWKGIDAVFAWNAQGRRPHPVCALPQIIAPNMETPTEYTTDLKMPGWYSTWKLPRDLKISEDIPTQSDFTIETVSNIAKIKLNSTKNWYFLLDEEDDEHYSKGTFLNNIPYSSATTIGYRTGGQKVSRYHAQAWRVKNGKNYYLHFVPSSSYTVGGETIGGLVVAWSTSPCWFTCTVGGTEIDDWNDIIEFKNRVAPSGIFWVQRDEEEYELFFKIKLSCQFPSKWNGFHYGSSYTDTCKLTIPAIA